MNAKYINFIKLLFGDVRFWILLFFVVRLFNINAPIFDSHNWRQADGYAIARNFFEIDANIFYPRIDHAGNLTGIMGSEFPIMNYLVFGLYKIFGVDWWQARLLNLMVSSLGCLFFYKIIFQFIKKQVAFPSTLILLASLWFSHSRKFMPDVFSTSLVIIAIYFGLNFLYSKKNWHISLYFILITFGLLSKLPSFIMTGLLVPVIFESSVHIKRKLLFVFVSIVAIIPAVWWYFYWAPKITSDYGFFYFFMGSSLSESVEFLRSEWQNVFSRFYVDAMGYVGFAFYVLGVVYSLIKKEKKLLIILISAFIFQLIFMLKAGGSFAHHTYYIIPFVPIMAIFVGFFISRIQNGWIRLLLIIIIAVESVLNLQHDFKSKPSASYLLQLESVADSYTSKEDLIIINNTLNPKSLYFAHRKGWGVKSKVISDSDFLEDVVEKGCQLFIWDRHSAELPVNIPYFKLVKKTTDFGIYKPEETIRVGNK